MPVRVGLAVSFMAPTVHHNDASVKVGLACPDDGGKRISPAGAAALNISLCPVEDFSRHRRRVKLRFPGSLS